MRVYLPATLPMLRGWWAAGSAPVGRPACAVTPTVREWYAEGDDEELEWAAQTLAGRAALRLLADEPAAPRRRVVVAADVAAADVAPDEELERGSVRVGAAVPAAAWAAVLVDEDGAAGLVGTAAAAIGAADAGDEDAALAVGDADDAELLWWGVDELPVLLG